MKTRFFTRVRRFALLALILTLVTASNLSLSSARPAVSPVPSPPSSVAGWGDNSLGQLNIPAGLNDATAIAAGLAHNLALRSNGTVVGWGNNVVGEATPPAGLSNVVAIAANGFLIGNIPGLSVALKSDGTVVTWGLLGEQSFPGNAVAIAAGGIHILALQSDGTVVGFGDDSFGQATPPAGLSNVVAVSAGLLHSLALKSDGTVVGWGDNQACQATPPSCISGATAISAGAVHSLTLQGQSCVQVGCSPQQNLDLLIGQIQALVTAGTLTQNQGDGLIDKIEQVIVKLDNNQTGAACNQLDSFINQVNAFISNGSLTQAQGQSLINAVNAIKADIGC
jgi:hypothetical protein